MEIDSILFNMQNAQFGSHGINDDGLAVGEHEVLEPPHDHKNCNDNRRPRTLVEWQITNYQEEGSNRIRAQARANSNRAAQTILSITQIHYFRSIS